MSGKIVNTVNTVAIDRGCEGVVGDTPFDDSLRMKSQTSDKDVMCAGYAPTQNQQRFHRSKGLVRCVFGGRRSGKTISGAAELIIRIYDQLHRDLAANRVAIDYAQSIAVRSPHRRYWVVAPTYELTLEPQRFVFRFLPRSELAKLRKDDGRAKWFGNEHRLILDGDVEVHFRSAEDPVKLVGVSVDGLWLTEGAKLKREAWENVAPTLAEKRAWVIAESTPHAAWFYEELWLPGQRGNDRSRPEYESFMWSMADNPTIPRERIELLRRQLPKHIAAREIDGNPEVLEGQVYEMFGSEHVTNGIPSTRRQFKRIVAGVDFGFTSPGALVIVGLRGDDTACVVEEQYASGRPPDGWIAAFRDARKKWGIECFYVDPSAAWLVSDMQRASLPALGANNDRYRGITTVMSMLHEKRLTIRDDCVNLIREMRTYHWEEQRSGLRREVPAPNQEDHAVDSLRYALVSEVCGPAIWGIR